MSKTLITGASGQLGQHVINFMVEKGNASDIVALVRTDEQAESFAAKGIETRRGDYDKPETLAPAFAGIDRLLLISSSNLQSRFPQHEAVVNAAKEAGVGFIAYTSILNAADSPMDLALDHKQTEALIKDSGIPHTFLRNGWYSENRMMTLAQDIEMGQHFGAAGTGEFSFAPRNDYAEAAAIVMLGGYDGQILELAGDKGVSLQDYAKTVSKVSGKSVNYVNLSEADLIQGMVGAGLPEFLAKLLASTDAAVEGGALFDDSKTLSNIIGHPTSPLEDTVRAALS